MNTTAQLAFAGEPEDESRQSKGGKARARKLSKAELSDSARKAAEARWGGKADRKLPRAVHGSDDRPLKLGDVEISCYVLDDGRRVISQRGMKAGIGMSASGGSSGAHRMARFVESLEAKGIDTNGLSVRIGNPIRFVPPQGGAAAYGYEATILPELCNAILEARRLGKLHAQQAHLASHCELLVRAFAHVGIIALIDEATGYQEHRTQTALADILEAFIAKELQQWVKTFPMKFYQGIFRLWRLPFDPQKPILKRPGVVGMLTNQLVYERLAPGVLKDLQRLNPIQPSGRRAHKHHQYLTPDFGHPKLQAHISAVIALMEISDNKADFLKHVNKALPKYQDMPLFASEHSSDEG